MRIAAAFHFPASKTGIQLAPAFCSDYFRKALYAETDRMIRIVQVAEADCPLLNFLRIQIRRRQHAQAEYQQRKQREYCFAFHISSPELVICGLLFTLVFACAEKRKYNTISGTETSFQTGISFRIMK
jgi:hypothetical protein